MEKRNEVSKFPTIRWVTISTLLGIGFLCVYWWTSIYPYYRLEKAVVLAPTREIRAEDVGPVNKTTLSEGDQFEQGAPLFALQSLGNDLRVEKIQNILDQSKQTVFANQVKIDELMEQYTYLQKELGLTGPLEVTDELLSEVDLWKRKNKVLLDEIALLEGEKKGIEQALLKQVGFAPFNGMVIKRFLQEGEKAVLGSPVMLICSKDLFIEAEIPERMLSKIELGMPATVKLESYPGKSWEGKIAWISPTAADGRLKVRVAAQNLPFKTGLSADVSIKIR